MSNLCGQCSGIIISVCVFWPCGCSVVYEGLFVGFWWPVSTWLTIGVLVADDVAVVGVVWPLPA